MRIMHGHDFAGNRQTRENLTTPTSPAVHLDQVYTYDGLHPNETGARKMADRWYEALAEVLGQADPVPG